MSAPQGRPTGAAAGAAEERVNILLVDDRPDKLLALESILGDLGENMVRATSGREALRALLQQEFAVILLDVNMPIMDGFETAALARQRERSERTPIIFFTAQPDAEQALFRSYKLGGVDFIRTPVVPEILKAKVAVFVDLYRKTEQVKQQAEEMRRLQEREHQSQLAEATDRLETETKRNRFFTLAVDMLAIAEFGGTFKQLNPTWEKTLGFSDAELTSRPFIEFIHPDDQESVREHLERLRSGSASSYFEHRFACKGGGYRWLGWTAAPFLSEGLLYVFSRDLTDRKVAEEERVRRIREQTARAAAEASERRAAFLAEATGSLSGSLDEAEILGGLAELAVPGLADWCFVDYTDDALGPRRAHVTHGDDTAAPLVAEVAAATPTAEDAASPQAEVMRTGQAVLVRITGDPAKDPFAGDASHRRLVEMTGANSMIVVPLRCRNRCLAALTFISSDAQRRYERDDVDLAEELARRAALAVDNARLYTTSQEARKAAETANRAKDEFLATLSHELRTPLTPILGWTVMLRSGTLDQASMIRGLEVIERNVRAQTQLIGDLLDVSRIITGKLRLDAHLVDIVPVIEAGVEAVRPPAEAKDIMLVLDLAPDLPQVNADPDRLQQVVWNLVSNAVKFTPAGGRIDVRLRQTGSRLQVSVSDSGKGIAPSFLPYVFDRFRQADSTSTRTHGGLGLGLAIVRHLVELHGGTVEATSDGEDRGSTFTVELPHAASVAEPVVPPAVGEEASHDPGVRLDGIRVMVVDDDTDIRDFLRLSLTQYGAEVMTMASSREALAALQEERPDVLVSDIAMPDEDGYAFIRSVRALGDENGGQVPAAALTAYAKGEDGARVLSAGYQVHLPKPVEPLALAHAVATLAGRKAPRVS